MSTIRNISNAIQESFNQTCIYTNQVKNGLVKAGKESSYVLYSAYANDGFEKIGTFALTALRAANIKSPLTECLAWQKNWYAVTKSLAAPAHYFKLRAGRYVMTLPQRRAFDEPVYVRGQAPRANPIQRPFYRRIDICMICMDIGSVFGSLKFVQQTVYSFPEVQRWATALGNYQVPVFNKQFNQVFLLQSLCDRPADLFVFVGSLASVIARVGAIIEQMIDPIDVNDPRIAYIKNPSHSLSNLMSIAGDTGRMALIALGRVYGSEKWFTLYLDLPIRSIGLIKFIFDKEMGRQDRQVHTGL